MELPWHSWVWGKATHALGVTFVPHPVPDRQPVSSRGVCETRIAGEAERSAIGHTGSVVDGRGRQWAQLCVVALASVLVACDGTIEKSTEPTDSVNGPGGGAVSGQPGGPGGPGGTGAGGTSGDGSGGSTGGGGTGGGRAGTPGDPRIPARIWRLSPAQLNDEVQRLLGDAAPEIDIPASAAEHGITNIAANGVVDLGNASVLADGMRAIATWAASQGASVSRCTNHGTVACIDEFLDWFVSDAFRRPATAAELAELRALFDDLYATYDYDYAFAGVVRAVLLSPDFLYRTELGTAAEPTVLTQHEIANLLAFAITDKSPDAELLQAAERGELTDADERERQARRLMDVSAPAWQRFFWDWLGMETLDSQGEEVGLDPALIEQMREEYREFVREVIVTQRGGLRDVLSASYTYVRPELAAHYGATHPGGGLARVDLDPSERGGLFTQGAWLVSHGKRGGDNVVRRGMAVFVHAMCNDISRPPNLDVQAELLKLTGPNATVREKVDARGSSGTCGGCHRVPDSVGMVFESFTSDGQVQTTYPDGEPVDTNIDVMGIGQFDNARAFVLALVDDARFQSCFVQRLAHQLVGIDLGAPSTVAWTQEALARFSEADTSLEELLVALVRHPAFIERGPQAEAP